MIIKEGLLGSTLWWSQLNICSISCTLSPTNKDGHYSNNFFIREWLIIYSNEWLIRYFIRINPRKILFWNIRQSFMCTSYFPRKVKKVFQWIIIKIINHSIVLFVIYEKPGYSYSNKFCSSLSITNFFNKNFT